MRVLLSWQTQLQARPQTLVGESRHGPRFEVIAPLGEVVPDTRPTFRWKSLADATDYTVAIFDARLNPVQSSPRLQDTEWTPNRPLKRGQLYEWQVTVTRSHGNSVNSPSPPSAEAKFQILDQEKLDELMQFQKAHPGFPMVLGIAGLPEKGQYELQQVSQNDPDYSLAQILLRSIEEIRNAQRSGKNGLSYKDLRRCKGT